MSKHESDETMCTGAVPSVSQAEIEDSVPAYLRNCPVCFGAGRILGVYEEHCVMFECSIKDKADHSQAWWGVCLKCGSSTTKQKKPITSQQQWVKHMRNMHKRPGTTIRGKRKKSKKSELDEVYTTEMPVPEPDDAFPLHEDHDNPDTGINSMDTTEARLFGQSHHFLKGAMSSLLPCDARGENLGFTEGSRSARYFQQNFLSSSGKGGMDYLVKQTLINSKMAANAYQNEAFALPTGHALLQIRIAQLVFRMTPQEKEMLLNVMNGSAQIGIENGYSDAKKKVVVLLDDLVRAKTLDMTIKNAVLKDLPELSSLQTSSMKNAFQWSTHIPGSVNDIRRTYIEGAFSILQNLPYPEIMTDIKEHSYVSVIDCIRDFLAHEQCRRMATISQDIDVSGFTTVMHPSESKRAKEFLKVFPPNAFRQLKGYVIFWSDDVEPNRLSKAGRGSVWMCTMTIGTQLGDGHNLNNTYPIAVGKKGDDHDPIIERIEEDMKKLRLGQIDPFYVGAMKARTSMLISDLAHLADQPERRGFNYLRLGGRGFTARFGVSANHQECYQEIRACASCSEQNKARLKGKSELLMPLPECRKCMNWDVLKAETDLGLALPPDNYPLLRSASLVSESPTFYELSPHCRLVRIGDVQKIKPFRISYNSLKGAIELAHECYCNYGWSSKNVSAYLRVEGINEDFISRTMEHATRCYALKMAMSADGNADLPVYYNTILKDAERYPHQYARVPFPPAWNREGFELQHHPDVIMHLLFLGIVDDSMQLIQNWLKATKRNTAFIKANAPHLERLIKMDIQWVNVLRFTGEGFGHWVSENYLGFARLAPWFYQNIEYVPPEVIVLPPEDAQKGWNKKHNEHWLKLRGLDTSGKANELRKRVEEYMAQDNPPPVIEEPERRVSDIEELVVALYTLLECVMSTVVTPNLVAKTGYAVRVYLSAYDTLNASVKGASSSIFGVFNLACLMNLPDAMAIFGPLRQLWEGATRGEGFLRFAKPLMTQGFKHDKWHHHLLQKMAISKAFRNILPQEEKCMVPINSIKGALSSRKAFFYKHKSQYDFEKDFNSDMVSTKTPISVILVLTVDGSVQVMAVVDTYEKVIRITCQTRTASRRKFGLHYYEFEHEETLTPWADIAADAKGIGYGLLLPLLADRKENQHMFSLIGSNWKVLGPATKLCDLVDVASANFD